VDTLDGCAADFTLGEVQGSIVRLIDPVPAAANVADAAYRKHLQEYFEDVSRAILPARRTEPHPRSDCGHDLPLAAALIPGRLGLRRLRRARGHGSRVDRSGRAEQLRHEGD
jgi:hypothetical protein